MPRTAQAPSALGRELARRRGRRRWVTLFVVLVVLAALFEGADLLSRRLAQDTIASRAVSATGASGAGASISGWPFLVEVAGGNVQQVTVDLRSVPIGQLTVSQLDVVLTGIGIDTHALFADRALRLTKITTASVHAVVTAAELSAATGHTVSFRPDGTVGVVILGHTVTAQVAIVDGHVLELEHSGTNLLRVNLAQSRLVPECSMELEVSSQAVSTSCSVSPVPQRILAALSGAAAST